MKKSLHGILIFSLVFLAASFADAKAPAWTLDKAHSGVYFDIQHIYSTVRGNFEVFDADIRFDPADLAGSRFDFTVSVRSINTQNAKRDRHLMSGDFFDEKQYPEMTFKSSSIKHIEGSQYTVNGTMIIKGVSQNMTVPFTYFGSKPNPFNPAQLVAGFEAELSIDRLSYHVGNGKFFKMGVVGKDVRILVAVEATREK